MARKRRSIRRYASRGRRFLKGGSGLVGQIVDGALVGAGENLVNAYAGNLFGFGDTLVDLGVGWYRKNPVWQTIGGYKLGYKLASMLTGASNGSSTFIRNQVG